MGPAVTQFQPGDDVFGVLQGAYASTGPESKLRKPAGVSFQAAAGRSRANGPSALREARVQPARRCSSTAPARGLFAVQIAKIGAR